VGHGARAVEGVAVSSSSWRGTRVFITGHTGFKGSWLALMLTELGAMVHGLALEPPTVPSLFATACFADSLASHVVADVRDLGRVRAAMAAARPSVVFHLAAQPLVRRSYREPVDTFATNVMGTVHVLQAAAEVGGVEAVISVTSDKCYENRERPEPYREHEAMGGHDPYSASKGCAELATAAWRRSFLGPRGVRVASARAGNVIGGGDWAEDRLVPDFLRAIDAGRELVLRSPDATRPWQHVLEPLAGYVRLAELLRSPGGERFADAWNFGPSAGDVRPVRWVAQELCAEMPGASWSIDRAAQPHESGLLALDSAKARELLGWTPRWDAAQAIRRTLDWHRAWRAGKDMRDFSLAQLREHAAAVPAPVGGTP
jgi:CDP-glucose 4,6-dehydratase